VLVSDGTNNVYSTELWPVPGVVGQTMYSDGTNWVTLAAGAAGKVLVGAGAAAPVWSTPTFPNASATAGKIIISDGTNWIASTPTYPTAATTGKVLVGNGTNWVESTPTFPNASATTRKVIVSDGTNWVASTETYATPGAVGNMNYSDGTNWVNLAAGATTKILVGGGAAAPVWTEATGTGAPVRAGSPTFTTQITTPIVASGNVPMSVGDATTDTITFVTDGTGNAELVFPADSIGDADIDWGSGAGQIDLADIPGGVSGASVWDFGGATSLEIPNAADPDLTVTGQVAQDTDGGNVTGDVSLRGFDGTNQFLVARKLKEIQCTIIKPNDLADATRDKVLIWSNETGMTFTITEIKAWADVDDTAFTVEKYNADGASNQGDLDAVNCTTGAGPYTADETTISDASVPAGYVMVIDFDDTDDPGWVKVSIMGWFNSNVD